MSLWLCVSKRWRLAGNTLTCAISTPLPPQSQLFEASGGYDADRRIGNVLTGLGFQREQWDKNCQEFSGGWQMRM